MLWFQLATDVGVGCKGLLDKLKTVRGYYVGTRANITTCYAVAVGKRKVV